LSHLKFLSSCAN